MVCVIAEKSLSSPNMLGPSNPILRTRIPRHTCRDAPNCRNPTIIVDSGVLVDQSLLTRLGKWSIPPSASQSSVAVSPAPGRMVNTTVRPRVGCILSSHSTGICTHDASAAPFGMCAYCDPALSQRLRPHPVLQPLGSTPNSPTSAEKRQVLGCHLMVLRHAASPQGTGYDRRY